ncbi:PqqD family protein [Solimonas sp. SE-A11]|uniref:PqqD family protein n=1 Tax=Solimonas sp. SE-A11 TaxID=3054954 RepID=UPI00259CC0C4|nr:PqqD family protein [Solimonas sp. SE-A11]MDM4772590.1 PqqD family protein [Solimonas sp. SE-A11]
MTSRVSFRPASWVYWNAAGSELVLFDTRNGSYHALNASGSAIWELIGEWGEPAQVVAALQIRFPESGGQLAIEVEQFIARALELGLLVSGVESSA